MLMIRGACRLSSRVNECRLLRLKREGHDGNDGQQVKHWCGHVFMATRTHRSGIVKIREEKKTRRKGNKLETSREQGKQAAAENQVTKLAKLPAPGSTSSGRQPSSIGA